MTCDVVYDVWAMSTITGGLFLVAASGVLGQYYATVMVCGALLGIALGLAIPFFMIANQQGKLLAAAASLSVMGYGALFWGEWLVTNRWFWAYLCIAAIVGMWWFGAETNKRVVSWSLTIVGLVRYRLLFLEPH
jgi:hypothetical protein